MTFPIRSKRGFYVMTPFLGVVFFMIVMSLAAFVGSENEQSLKTAKSSDINDDMIFAIGAAQADVLDVQIQNKLQWLLDRLELDVLSADPTLNFVGVIEETAEKAIMAEENYLTGEYEGGISGVYVPALRDNFNLDCSLHEPTYAHMTMIFPVLYSGSRFINDENMTEPRLMIAAYAMDCTPSYDPQSRVQMEFQGRSYYLDASGICAQAPKACGR